MIQNIIEETFNKGYVINQELYDSYIKWKINYYKDNKAELMSFAKKVLAFKLKNNSVDNLKELLGLIKVRSNKSKDYSEIRRNMQERTLISFFYR